MKRGEWWAGELAAELGMPAATLNSWISRGWVEARRLGDGVRACWVVRAGRAEQARLRRLRRWLREHHRKSPPDTLTHPASHRAASQNNLPPAKPTP